MRKFTQLIPLMAALGLPGVVSAAPRAVTAATPPFHGVDPGGMDPSAMPCRDFWRFANGHWLSQNPIPRR